MSTTLRYYEYYQMQDVFDRLYERSLNNATKGMNLYQLVVSESNILLAYRLIKANKGSHTAGVDGVTIDEYKAMDKEHFITTIRQTLENYVPQPVRRVNIPKSNGKTRPLGIPTMRDRIIQQMFKQILEPICEAKFYKHSYGFRPNRSTEHALARCNFLAYSCQCHYVVDIDINGFFDHVHHGKLLHQLYTIGIKDKRVLAIIAKMLKAPIEGNESVSGVPQGGLISTLLSNVVLNELDWWVANQWENFKSSHDYSSSKTMYKALKLTKLKEMHIVRYCDDFKIFTTTPKHALRVFHAIKGFIENRLKLQISTEKSRITNLRRKYSEFLGFEIKVEKQRNHKYVSISRISRKSKNKIKQEVRKRIKEIQRNPTSTLISRYNLYIRGIQNYYCRATRVSLDFSSIYYSCLPAMYNRLKSIGTYEIPRSPPLSYKKFYTATRRTFRIKEKYLFPLADIKWKKAMFFQPIINNYTEQGRILKLKRLKPTVYSEIQKICLSENFNHSLEYSDNRISTYSMQKGLCAVTRNFLTAEMMHCHHILPKMLGGSDDFNNLVIIHRWVHLLIHATTSQTIEHYLRLLKLSGKQLEKINNYREKCNLDKIELFRK